MNSYCNLCADLFIDYSEFAAALADEPEKEWESLDSAKVFEEEEFQDFEKQRIDEIRDSFAKGKWNKFFFVFVTIVSSYCLYSTYVYCIMYILYNVHNS